MHWSEAKTTLLQKLITAERPGLITDMDGTISPIVPRPEEAQITPRSRELLDALKAHMTVVAVVSGRSVGDLRARIGLSGLVYTGNHGIERWKDGEVQINPAALEFRPAMINVLSRLQPILEKIPGSRLEDKGVIIAIHSRQTTNPEQAEAQLAPILQEIATATGLKLHKGRRVFELRPPLNMNKGIIFRQLIEDYRLDAALYLGDDTTDADALKMARELRQQGGCFSVGVGVESDEMPAVVRENADLMASNISDVEDLLVWLLQELE